MGGLQPWHWVIVIAVFVLLFGAKKLPDAARSLGKSMRIFKSEIKEMQSDSKQERRHWRRRAPSPTPIASERADSRHAGSGGRSRRPTSARPDPRRPDRAAALAPRHRHTPVQTPGILKKLDPRRRRSRVNPDGTMSLVEHLHELRTRLLIAVAAIVVTTTLGFFWYTPRRLRAAQPGGLAARAVLFAAGVVSRHHRARRGMPTARHRTVRPVHAAAQGRPDRGHRDGLPGLAVSAVGVHHARLCTRRNAGSRWCSSSSARRCSSPEPYWPTSCCRRRCGFLLTVGSDVQVTALSGDQYFGFLINLLLVFGFSFEFPLLIIMLNLVGVLHLRAAQSVATWPDLRAVRVRRVRHAGLGPVLDAGAGAGAVGAARGLDPDRPYSRQAQGPS